MSLNSISLIIIAQFCFQSCAYGKARHRIYCSPAEDFKIFDGKPVDNIELAPSDLSMARTGTYRWYFSAREKNERNLFAMCRKSTREELAISHLPKYISICKFNRIKKMAYCD
jgi:hypothetical protein